MQNILCRVIFYTFMNSIIAKGMNCRKVCFNGLHFQSSHHKHPSTPKCLQKFMNVGGATYPFTSVLHRKKLLLMWWWAFIVWQTGTFLHVRSADLIFCTFHTTLLCLKWPQGQKSLILAFLHTNYCMSVSMCGIAEESLAPYTRSILLYFVFEWWEQVGSILQCWSPHLGNFILV